MGSFDFDVGFPLGCLGVAREWYRSATLEEFSDE
jgi:hypothetical protein